MIKDYYWIIWMIRDYTNDIIKVMIKRFITGWYEWLEIIPMIL